VSFNASCVALASGGDACLSTGPLAGLAQMALTRRDREILDFEGSWWIRPGPKAAAIRNEIGLAPSAYYRRLALLVDSEEAKAHAPMVVVRLRRRRRDRRKERVAGFAEPQHPRR